MPAAIHYVEGDPPRPLCRREGTPPLSVAELSTRVRERTTCPACLAALAQRDERSPVDGDAGDAW